jgi:hypothetical protein
VATESKQVLYLLVDEDEPYFKVGISSDVLSRIGSLFQNIDADRVYVSVCDALPAAKIEKILHTVFHTYRVNRTRGSGRTEWFDIACHQQLIDFVRTNRNQLGCSEFQLLPLRQDPDSGPRASGISTRRHAPNDALALLITALSTELRGLFLTGTCIGRAIVGFPHLFTGEMQPMECCIFRDAQDFRRWLQEYKSCAHVWVLADGETIPIMPIRRYLRPIVGGWALVAMNRPEVDEHSLFLTYYNSVLDSITQLPEDDLTLKTLRDVLELASDGDRMSEAAGVFQAS